MKKRFTEAQIVGFLREADAGVAVKDLCRTHGFSDASATVSVDTVSPTTVAVRFSICEGTPTILQEMTIRGLDSIAQPTWKRE